MKADIKEVTDKRGAIYGDFRIQFDVAQELKDVVAKYDQALNSVQKETLDMLMHKVSRVLVGDPDYLDNWVDIQGYASLAEKDILERDKINANSR